MLDGVRSPSMRNLAETGEIVRITELIIGANGIEKAINQGTVPGVWQHY